MSKFINIGKKGSWGIGIAVLYGSFVIFSLALVTFGGFQSFHLVEGDYYQRELDYQSRIDKLNQAKNHPEGIKWNYDSQADIVTFEFENILDGSRPKGRILFFRPSDPGLDFKLDIKPEENGIQIVNVDGLAAGLWKIKVDWSLDSTEYYREDILVVE